MNNKPWLCSCGLIGYLFGSVFAHWLILQESTLKTFEHTIIHKQFNVHVPLRMNPNNFGDFSSSIRAVKVHAITLLMQICFKARVKILK